MLLYAQPLSHVAVLAVDVVTTTDADVSVCFGTQAVVVPEPLATYVSTLAATGRAHHIGIGSTVSSP